MYLPLGVEGKLDDISQLKVKALILGPLHVVQANELSTLSLQEINPAQGSEDDLKAVLKKANNKGRVSHTCCQFILTPSDESQKMESILSVFVLVRSLFPVCFRHFCGA